MLFTFHFIFLNHSVSLSIFNKTNSNICVQVLQVLKDWVQTVVRSLGYVIVTKRSKTRHIALLSKVTLMCDRGGIYKRDKISSKNTGTETINSPFELVEKYSKMFDVWKMRVQCEKHKHEHALHMEGHPFERRLSNHETHVVVVIPRIFISDCLELFVIL